MPFSIFFSKKSIKAYQKISTKLPYFRYDCQDVKFLLQSVRYPFNYKGISGAVKVHPQLLPQNLTTGLGWAAQAPAGAFLRFCSLVLTAKKPVNPTYPKSLESLISLGDHLRKRRLDLGLLQKEVALTLGVDKMTINSWETGRYKPQLGVFPRIMAFLGYTPPVLVQGSTRDLRASLTGSWHIGTAMASARRNLQGW